MWDSIVFDTAGFSDLPFSKKDWETNGETAQDFINKYPVDKDVVNDLDPANWAREAFHISETFVYDGVKENVKVSADYVKAGKKLAEK